MAKRKKKSAKPAAVSRRKPRVAATIQDALAWRKRPHALNARTAKEYVALLEAYDAGKESGNGVDLGDV